MSQADHPLIQGLNPPQAEAVQHTRGPLLLLAGAGSGKTRVLTRRIAWLLDVEHVYPWRILAVTFTNKAAGEMKERVAELVGDRAQEVVVSTFHSACARFLRRDIEHIVFGAGDRARRYTSRFTIYDDDDQQRLIKALCKARGVDSKQYPPRKIRRVIDDAKNRMVGPEVVADELQDPKDPSAIIFRAYQDALLSANAVDFGDLVNLMVKLLRENPAVLARYQDRYRYLMVDEYQDTNKAQYELVKLLAGENGNVAVVGDDDQSIYRFRGADIRNILDFEKDFPAARVIKLEQNYRSTGNILAAAASVVTNNLGRKEKTLWTDKGDGEPLRTLVAQDEMEEASLVVEEMEKLRRSHNVRLGDMAVIYRTNAASRAFEQVLVRKRLPHVLVGGLKFYQRREVRDLAAYLKLVINPADDMAFGRVINVPTRGIGARSLDAIREEAEARGVPLLEAARSWGASGGGAARRGALAFASIIDQLTAAVMEVEPGELVTMAVQISGYAAMLEADDSHESQGRKENLQELARAVEEEPLSLGPEDEDTEQAEEGPMERLQAFLDRAALAGQAEELPDEHDGRLTLLTAHLAKGLEFPVVFVTGMFEGGFPHFMARELEEDIEEERRLVYVAFTRAQERLYVSRSRRRRGFDGSWQDVQPSRFLEEIPAKLLQRAGSSGVSRDGWGGAPSRVEQAARMQRLGFGETSRQPSRRGPDVSGRLALGARSAPVSRAVVPIMPSGEHRTRTPEGPEDLQPGTRVVHSAFGVGTIQRSDGPPSNLKLVIHFEQAGRKTLYARFAKLEILET